MYVCKYVCVFVNGGAQNVTENGQSPMTIWSTGFVGSAYSLENIFRNGNKFIYRPHVCRIRLRMITKFKSHTCE